MDTNATNYLKEKETADDTDYTDWGSARVLARWLESLAVASRPLQQRI